MSWWIVFVIGVVLYALIGSAVVAALEVFTDDGLGGDIFDGGSDLGLIAGAFFLWPLVVAGWCLWRFKEVVVRQLKQLRDEEELDDVPSL